MEANSAMHFKLATLLTPNSESCRYFPKLHSLAPVQSYCMSLLCCRACTDAVDVSVVSENVNKYFNHTQACAVINLASMVLVDSRDGFFYITLDVYFVYFDSINMFFGSKNIFLSG